MDEKIIELLEDLNEKLENSNALKMLILEKLGNIEYEIDNVKGAGLYNQISDVCSKLDDIELAIKDISIDTESSSLY